MEFQKFINEYCTLKGGHVFFCSYEMVDDEIGFQN